MSDVSLFSTRLLTGTTYRVRGSVNGVATSVDADLGATPTDQDALDALERGSVRNESGGTLAAGTLVYVSGWNETEAKPLISKADANVAGARARYVLRADIANNANGYANITHRLTGLNTTGATVGDPVYLSETAGGWTLTAPTAGSSMRQVVGHVAVVHASAGIVEFDLNSNLVSVSGRDIQAGAFKQKVVTGGAAGNLTLTGIAVGDELVGVIRLNRDATAANVDADDLTAEFTVTAPDTINNTAGTNTTGDKLIVTYIDKT